MSQLPILTILKKPLNLSLFLGVSVAFFAANYYAMKNLPHSNGFMCILGGNVTPLNITLGLILSLSAGLLVAALFEQFKQKQTQQALRVGSASGVGMIMGTLTSFCTICSVPIISLFGIGTAMSFISQYQLYFRIGSIALMFIGLYLINKQLKSQCSFFCKLGNASK